MSIAAAIWVIYDIFTVQKKFSTSKKNHLEYLSAIF